MRLAPIAFLSLLPGLAFSATLPAPSAEYRAEAAISVRVTQAVFSDGSDASGHVGVGWLYDDGYWYGDGPGFFDLSENLSDIFWGPGF